MNEERQAIASLCHTLREEGELTFSSRKELITSTADILAWVYREHLEYWRATAMDDRSEMRYWESKINVEVDAYREAWKKVLGAEASKKRLWGQRRKIVISLRNRKLLDNVLMLLEEESGQNCGISKNVMYVMDLNEYRLRKII